MRRGHDDAASARERRVEVLASVHRHALDHLVPRKVAQDQEVDQHAAIVLKCTPGDAGRARIGTVHTQHGGIVVERSAALPDVE